VLVNKLGCLSSRIHKDNKDKLKMVMDVETRWNSTYAMFKRLLKLRSSVVEVTMGLKKAENRKKCLKQYEWKNLEEVCKILEPFAEVTEEVSGASYPTLSLIFPLMYILEKVKGFENSTSPVIKSMAKEMSVRMVERWTKVVSNTQLLASVLDPRVKALTFLEEKKEQQNGFNLLRKKYEELKSQQSQLDIIPRDKNQEALPKRTRLGKNV